MKYFIENEEYPKFSDSEILPLGTEYVYVSSTFLNGFINYQDIVKAVLIKRYSEADIKLPEKPDFHTKIHEFGDDVLILSKHNDTYWYYWFDCDVSDCCIGRFKTSDTEEEIIIEFMKSINDNDFIDEFLEIPNDYFTGWISF